MKPNGVFYISGDKAGVAETRAFLKQRPQADLATQSGPMLVINGRLHPRFDRNSASLKARNGVGVRANGKVIFAISQGEVSFDAFARLFRDGLNCPHALFLDGGSAASAHSLKERLARWLLMMRDRDEDVLREPKAITICREIFRNCRES